MTTQQMKTSLTTFMEEIWNQGDFTHLADYVSDSYTIFNDPGDAWEGQTLNHDTFKERVMYSRNAFPDLCFDIQEMIAEENNVVATWVMSGTHEGDLTNLPVTGQSFAITGMTIYRFQDGKLIGHWQAYDRLGFMAQMGLLG